MLCADVRLHTARVLELDRTVRTYTLCHTIVFRLRAHNVHARTPRLRSPYVESDRPFVQNVASTRRTRVADRVCARGCATDDWCHRHARTSCT
jgi:hypothetical protein